MSIPDYCTGCQRKGLFYEVLYRIDKDKSFFYYQCSRNLKHKIFSSDLEKTIYHDSIKETIKDFINEGRTQRWIKRR